ncbi:GtrA family protein [Candidatus Roizmanbacteria bacterium]|nr:GtrA family protein [Candidatus Roizmanbacteria bacterium]
MAVIIVALEIANFQIIYLLTNDYMTATIFSFSISVVLNWIGSRLFIFGKSEHHPAKEFLMVLAVSLLGLLVQILTMLLVVKTLGLYPLLGKILSISLSFSWNYWARKNFIYSS